MNDSSSAPALRTSVLVYDRRAMTNTYLGPHGSAVRLSAMQHADDSNELPVVAEADAVVADTQAEHGGSTPCSFLMSAAPPSANRSTACLIRRAVSLSSFARSATAGLFQMTCFPPGSSVQA